MTLPGANLASNELLLKLCKAYFALRQLTDQAGVSLLIGLEEKTEKNVITKEEALLKLEAGEEIGSYGQFDIFTREESIAAQRIFAKRLQEWAINQAATEFYMIFIIKLLHPAPLMNSPSSSTCSHLLLVTSSHLDFPGGVMNRLSSPVGVLAP